MKQNNNLKIWTLCLAIVAAVSMTGCQREVIAINDGMDNEQSGASLKTSSGVTLGNRLQNAYSMYYMNIARAQLVSEGVISSSTTVNPTHLYVSFRTPDSAHLSALLNDTNITLFNYPLDYELIGEGHYIPIRMTDSIYTVVPMGYNLSGLNPTLLATCCIPEDDDPEELQLIEERALLITNNLDNDRCIPSYVTPSGRYTIFDKSKHTIDGLKRVKVIARKIVKVAKAYTDEDGYYTMNKGFFCKPTYTISFENKTGFKIWGNLLFFGPSYLYLNKQNKSGHSRTLYEDSYGWTYGTINNAADKFYQICPEKHIAAPPSDLRIWLLDIKYKSFIGATPMLHHVPTSPEIKSAIRDLYRIDSCMGSLASFAAQLVGLICPDVLILRHLSTSDSIYRNIFHELSHASHYSKVGATYWCNYINQTILNGGYGNGPNNNNGIIGVGEMWGFYSAYYLMNEYRPSVNNGEVDSLSRWWFRPDLPVHLNDSVPPLIYRHIFDCLTTGATDHIFLKNIMKSNYGYSHGINFTGKIDSLFSSHGFNE